MMFTKKINCHCEGVPSGRPKQSIKNLVDCFTPTKNVGIRNDIVFLFSLVLFASSFLFAQEVSIPILKNPVTDLTNKLSQNEQASLRAKILEFEDSTSNQIVVLLLPTIGENEIRDFGIEILKQNKIGQKGKDNGVLILVAKDDRKISIEVGYGLEGVLTDVLCSDIIENQMKPEFRNGNFYGGIDGAIDSIIAITKGEYTGNPKKKHDADLFGFVIIFIVILFAGIFSRRNRRYGISSRGYRGYNNWWWGGGGFGGGSSGGSSWGSFGGGGGGWSGGGGSFGGGGASGSW